METEELQPALLQLAGVMERRQPEQGRTTVVEDPLLATCRLVGQAAGITIQEPLGAQHGRTPRDPLVNIARASRARVRRAALCGRWWNADHGPLLAFLGEDRRPVALLPVGSRRYLLLDPVTGSRTPVTPELAELIQPHAYTFYRPFPTHTLRTIDIIRFGIRACAPDFRRVLLMGILGGVLALLPPLVTQAVFDTVIPAGDRSQLLAPFLALVAAACAATLFQLVRGIAMLRIETRMSAAIQVAVWDRILRLPVPFFREFTAGDLAVRAMGIDAIRQLLTSAAVSSLLAGVFSLLNLGLMLYYDTQLAVPAMGLVLVAIVATTLAGYVQLRYEKPRNAAQTRLAGTILELVGGIAKLRVANAEARAFGVWAGQFALQKRLALKVRSIENWLTLFNATFPLVAAIVIFATLALRSAPPRSTGTFLAFMAAFGGLLGAAQAASSGFLSLLRIVPIYQQARPILEAVPEVDTARYDPGELSGAIEATGVTFRYAPDGPAVLHNVTFEAHPGEFVAIVGPSGSGKSTLLRLLLGFERPELGSIYYDGQDLAELDQEAVRSQIGVVLQNGGLIPGDIFTNITGSSLLTLDDAWAAATMAGLDADIRQMPMGMHTMVSEASSTFSGGQRQRLMIARAIVAKPGIIFFDEATSALDNQTQAIVSKSLASLRATRLVIAHRLSTIMQADRIYVIVAGRVVQQGTFADLASQPGPFHELAQRQLA